MGFLAPVSLWFLIAIPILLLFYFFKKQYDKQPISSLYLWEKALKEWETDRWWKKLQKNILLFLQLLILLFLIIALLRPYLPGSAVNGDNLIIIVDPSASMSLSIDEETRLSQVKREARKLVNGLGNDQRVNIILAEQTPKLLVSKEEDSRIAENVIEKMNITYQHENLLDSIQLAQSLLSEGNGEIHVFTDNLTIEELKSLSIKETITVHNQEMKVDNLGITTFGVNATNDHVDGVVNIHNQTDKDQDVEVVVSSNGESLLETSESIRKRSNKTIKLTNLPMRDIYKVKIQQDSYTLDNERYAFLPNEKPSTIYTIGETNPFVIKALRSAGLKTVTIPKGENGSYSIPNDSKGVYILSGVPSEEWPTGPKLLFSPELGGPFDFKEKNELAYTLNKSTDDRIMLYTNIDRMYLGKAYKIGDLKGLEPLLQSGEQVVLAKGRYEGSKIVIFPFDLQDSDWPLHPGFPILLANSMEYLKKFEHHLGYYEPSDQIELQLSSSTESAAIETLETKEVKKINLQESFINPPSKPGVYQLHEKSNSNSMNRPFIVQLPIEEVAVDSAKSFSLNKDQQSSLTKISSKQEIWRWFAAIVLLLLFIEWEVYRRGISSR